VNLPVSVVVCAKNEEARLGDCLTHLAGQGAAEVIVVDGASTDHTVRVALAHHVRVIVSEAGNLSLDRQVGADAASSVFVAFVDADHRLPPATIARLVDDLREFDVDGVQAGMSIVPRSFWNRAESDFLEITHNTPHGVRSMIGTAPAVFRRQLIEDVRFDCGAIDDTDFMYRLHRDTGYRVGIGRTVVPQDHEPGFGSYVRKWRWYGRGDGEFMRKHRERRRSMLFHLLIRYPLVYPVRAVRRGRPRAIPYAVLQGWTRALAALT
jgi:glycosyltransferase involved in cell wall biosynthesis